MLHTIRRIHPHFPITAMICRVTDGGSIALGLFAALRWRQEMTSHEAMLVAVSAIAIYYVISEFTGMYRSWRGASSNREIACALSTWAATLVILMLLGVAMRFYDHLSRGLIIAWFVMVPFAILGCRTAIRLTQSVLRQRGFNSRRFAIVGINHLGIQLAENIEHTPETGLKLIGFFDDRPAERTPDIPTEYGERAGNIADLVQMARSGEVDAIYITFPMRAEDRIKGVLEMLSDSTASVYIVPDFFVFELLHSRWTDIGGVPAVSVFENPFYGVDGLAKRMVDLTLGTLILAAVAIPMLLIAVVIKLTSPGPVFFRQRRYGLDGKEILVWKFRSMSVMENAAVVTQAKKDDPRVTPFGAFLRKSSLDELPQLFNVLEGSMSLVGPRPHATAHNEMYRTLIDGYMLRHKVKPGITGLAQVNGWRGETDTLEKMQKRVDCDHQYIREWSLWLDIKILFKTIFVVLSRQNAH